MNYAILSGDSLMPVNRREKILDALIKTGARKGIDNITMRDIAKITGIAVGAIYLNFSGKEELIDALDRRIFKELDLFGEQILNLSASAEKKLHDLLVGDVELYSKFIRQNQCLFEFFCNVHSKYKNLKESRFYFQQKMGKIGLIKRVLEEGVQEGSFIIDNVAESARLIFTIYDSRHFRGSSILEREHEKIIKDAEIMFDILLNGIKRLY
jgi:AcrR family transcriptional regulator